MVVAMPDTDLTAHTVRIYALLDPRTGDTRYVGRTEGALARRLSVHMYWCRTGRVKGPRGQWIRELLSNDLRPKIVELEICNRSEQVDRERWWMHQMRASGASLVNTQEASA